MTATELLYQAAGSPVMLGNVAGVCRTCGAQGIGVPFSEWVKDSFNNHDALHVGEIVCHACLFSFEEKCEPLRLLAGKDKPQKMRTYSHFVLGGRWHVATKGQKPLIRDLLFQLPDVAVISVSAQKHLLFRARVGWWQFEEQALRPCPDLLKCLLNGVEALYVSFSKEEISTGDYLQHRILEFGLDEWRTLENQLRPRRGSLPFEVACYLAQKGTDDASGDCRQLTDPDMAGDTGKL